MRSKKMLDQKYNASKSIVVLVMRISAVSANCVGSAFVLLLQ